MDKYSYINNADPEYIDSLYKEYKLNPDSVDQQWRTFFEGFEFSLERNGELEPETAYAHRKERNVINLINDYRKRGHLFTKTNPVRTRRKYVPTLDIENYGLEEKDREVVFQAGNEIGIGPATLNKIIEHLDETYCRSIGAEYMFIRKPDRVQWLQQRMESTKNIPKFSLEEKRLILHKLNQAVVFENFLHSKYVGQKRFSLSGGETLIPALNAVIERGANQGVMEFVLGMSHRGRLNILANILHKSYKDIFTEFEGEVYDSMVFGGDVKYHKGYSSTIRTYYGKQVHLSLIPNPSHLEAVSPVVEGVVKAKIDKRYKGDENKIVPVLIHGDAAIAAQGIAYEVIQMSLLPAYRTGGTIHLVVNNQVGFTTNYLEGRSSTYCTDVAKVTLSPVFHVNADDVEAVILAILMAMDYRQTFHTDVFIDFLGYRRHGHNEADEPRFTQPKLYKIIANHPDPRKIYYEKLLKSGSVEKGLAEEMEKEFNAMLQERLSEAKEEHGMAEISSLKGDWEGIRRSTDADFEKSPDTAVTEKKLQEIGQKIFSIPDDFKVFRKIRKLYDERKNKFLEGKNLDWAIGEFLAYGTLLNENVPIRISGQDTVRGTFSHRHAVLLSEDAEEKFSPICTVVNGDAEFQIINSPLSEYGTLGFEFGYAFAQPKGLTIWEAQFGDFSNGAQIIIDQFLCCSDLKWRRSNGLVLFLPHGYEGAGPEHSSARIERFLTLCAKNNMQLVNCTTPANLFHGLRRQVHQPFRIPLVIFTPKSLLRHPLCVSKIDEFTNGGFREVIEDFNARPQNIETVILCTGKIYYELYEYQQQNERKDVAVVRLEQYYPFPEKQLMKLLNKYDNAQLHLWVQEEPENMGVWPYLRRKFNNVRINLISRAENATPATGFHKNHQIEQQDIIDRAFNNGKPSGKNINTIVS
jgi:2-oxoglutarate dehydrogenase E1 component